MNIIKAQWYGNAQSPVMFMVDDLANAWIDLNGNGRVEPEEDWGHALDSGTSAFSYLTGDLLRDFHDAKVTFFVPLHRVPETTDHGLKIYFGPVNASEESSRFFRSIHEHPRFELAYHGISHGISGTKERRFVQEWISYENIDEALATIASGRELFKSVMGEYPSGGKYCGYQRNDFSDESIDRSGFLWWCRAVSGAEGEIAYFGNSRVVDIPTTVNGALFNFAGRPFYINASKRILGRPVVRKRDVVDSGREYIESLLAGRKLISIQEHISPSRTDGKRQMPNIFDDRESLQEILSYLKGKNVWYATGTEVAEYFEAYNATSIKQINDSDFMLSYNGRRLRSGFVTMQFHNLASLAAIRMPDGGTFRDSITPLGGGRFMVNEFPLVNGVCSIVP
jgi:hypothetical protein